MSALATKAHDKSCDHMGVGTGPADPAAARPKFAE